MNGHGILRFVATPELKETDKGVKYSRFTLCWNESRKDGEGKWVDTPNFYDFEIWDTAAEDICRKFTVGDPIYIESYTPREHKWIDKESGKNRSRIVFRINKYSRCPLTKRKEEKTDAS